jgi:aminoglycoside phosphotransferase (APT) family kinase protein
MAGTAIMLGDPYGSRELLADAAGWAGRLGRGSPDLGRVADVLVAALEAMIPPASRPVLVHGSYSHSHVFDLGTGPGVVDWDGFRQGAIELDAGRFLAGLSSLAAGRRRLRDEAGRAGTAFATEVAPLVDPGLLTWYRAAALLRLAYYASVRRPGRWESRAGELMAEGRALLAGA